MCTNIRTCKYTYLVSTREGGMRVCASNRAQAFRRMRQLRGMGVSVNKVTICSRNWERCMKVDEAMITGRL